MLRIFCFFTLSFTFGQVEQIKTWDASEIKSIHLDFPWASSVLVSTHNSLLIEVNYLKEGEYQNLFLLQGKIKGAGFYLEEHEIPSSERPVDKLSVHKVVANKIEIKIPTNLVLNLNLKEAQLKCSGVFESLNIGIEHGEATFNVADPKGTIISLAADLHFYGLNSPQLPKKLKASSALGSLVVHPN
ncbi:MAG: hypothetical protein ACI87X_001549 [Candidatus Arcticimaribacter sp.]|jgi:hypothetical protein